ncbi:hypothetical protein [Neobacillus niacini]|uniref:hypothetical protein n=1 Tax=Neobacillus niacini TaxID=86668 RepID=UPI0021CAF5FB|nr:hypothetical protein [Neobacillus niacini]MCM3766313.1 hypothetical protein [Neobacillus niacini]
MMDFNKMKDALHSIEMSKTMKKRIIENCNSVEKDKAAPLNFNRWISVACAFGILLSMIIGIPYLNKNGEVQVANFAITAYAVSDEGNQLHTNLSSEKATFELSTKERIGLVNSIGGVGANFIFTDVMLNVTGNDIDSITYTINKGLFIEDVTLTAADKEDKNWLLSEKIHVIYGEPGSDLYQGIKEIGNTYTVTYNKQDQYKYTLAIPHDGNDVVEEDIIIHVNVKYTDGNAEQQDIVVTQESNSMSLKLK